MGTGPPPRDLSVWVSEMEHVIRPRGAVVVDLGGGHHTQCCCQAGAVSHVVSLAPPGPGPTDPLLPTLGTRRASGRSVPARHSHNNWTYNRGCGHYSLPIQHGALGPTLVCHRTRFRSHSAWPWAHRVPSALSAGLPGSGACTQSLGVRVASVPHVLARSLTRDQATSDTSAEATGGHGNAEAAPRRRPGEGQLAPGPAQSNSRLCPETAEAWPGTWPEGGIGAGPLGAGQTEAGSTLVPTPEGVVTDTWGLLPGRSWPWGWQVLPSVFPAQGSGRSAVLVPGTEVAVTQRDHLPRGEPRAPLQLLD